ncbi:MAG: LiaF-related protein [Porphyromonas sp.]|nr:LiaF-related protein [Porphyromonas sp.]
MNISNRKSGFALFFSLLFIIASGFLLSLGVVSGGADFESFVTILGATILYIMGVAFLGRFLAQNSPGSRYTMASIALLVIGIALLFLLSNMGMLDVQIRSMIFSWQMLLIAVGLFHLFRSFDVGGFLISGFGFAFLFVKISKKYPEASICLESFSIYWPIGVMILGALLFLYALPFIQNNRKKNLNNFHTRDYIKEFNGNGITDEGKIDCRYFFSGGEYVVLDPVFRGGRIDVLFGGVDLDLRQTSLPVGDTELVVTASFGGVEILLPSDWNIEIKSVSAFGGVSNKRPKIFNQQTDRKLIINVKSAVFGGVEIK